MFGRRRTIECLDRRFVIERGVFDPARHLSGVAFAPHLLDPQLGLSGRRVLDLGTGCGVLAAAAARAGAKVIAADVDPRAVECARANLTDLDVEVRLSDLFDAFEGERFDVVVTNPPYEIGHGRNRTLTSPDFLARFGAAATNHADEVIIGFPADDAVGLAATGLDLRLWRRVVTEGDALGIFRSVTTPPR